MSDSYERPVGDRRIGGRKAPRLPAILAALAALTWSACGADGPAADRPAERAGAGAPERAAAATSSCADLENVLERIGCFADLAGEAGDASRCDQAAEDAVRFHCYAIFAERRGDPEPCRRIPAATQEHRELRDACLADVAPVVERAELCEEVETPGLRDSCYLAVFRETGDSALCDHIEDPALKSACTGEPVRVE